jgi:hypothetical protein
LSVTSTCSVGMHWIRIPGTSRPAPNMSAVTTLQMFCCSGTVHYVIWKRLRRTAQDNFLDGRGNGFLAGRMNDNVVETTNTRVEVRIRLLEAISCLQFPQMFLFRMIDPKIRCRISLDVVHVFNTQLVSVRGLDGGAINPERELNKGCVSREIDIQTLRRLEESIGLSPRLSAASSPSRSHLL